MSPEHQPYRMTISLSNEDCRILKTCRDLGLEHFKVIDIRSSAKGSTRHLVTMSPEHFDRIPKGAFKVERPKGNGGTSAWFESKGCGVCKTIVSNGSFLVSGRSMEGRTIVYTFVAPDFAALKDVVQRLEEKGLKPKVLDVGRFSPGKGVLTAKQERVLHTALRSGFYEFPREIDIVELSRKLGVKPSSLSEMLRRGTRRLLEDHFE